jgi:hypothetical protein
MIIYCIPYMHSTQKEPLQKHCFGDCGKISMGMSVTCGEYGPCFVCTQEVCPYEKGSVGPCGEADATGDTIYMRILAPVAA